MILDTHPFLIPEIVQTFLYSLYLVSLGHALRWLLYEEQGWSLRSRNKVNWLLLTTAIVIFVFSTADVIFDISLHFTGGNVTQQLIISSVAIESATLLSTDAVLIIRCRLVYQRSWRAICIPSTLWLANVTCMVLWVAGYTMSVFMEAPYYKPRLPHLPSQVFYSCNFAMNLYSTAAIAHRVWRVARISNNRSVILYRVFRIVAGTGILYTLTSLPLVVSACLMGTHKPIYILCDAINFSVGGITFNLLLIFVGQLRANAAMGELSENGSLSTTEFDIPDTAINDFLLDESVTVHQKHTNNVKERIGKRSLSLLYSD